MAITTRGTVIVARRAPFIFPFRTAPRAIVIIQKDGSCDIGLVSNLTPSGHDDITVQAVLVFTAFRPEFGSGFGILEFQTHALAIHGLQEVKYIL